MTLNRDEVKILRENLKNKYRDTITASADALIITQIDDVISKKDTALKLKDVSVKDLLIVSEKYLQDFIDVETKKKGRNNYIRIMKQLRKQDPNLRTLLEQDGYIFRSREFVPLILDILDKEK